MLMVKSDNQDALGALKTLNEKIKRQNKKDKNLPDG
jgi:hypothetical protein